MKISKELFNELSQLRHAVLNSEGQEKNNPVPLFADVTPRPPSITEQIQRLLKTELSKQAMAQGYETFEESDDFSDEEMDDAPDSRFQEMVEDVPLKKVAKAAPVKAPAKGDEKSPAAEPEQLTAKGGK